MIEESEIDKKIKELMEKEKLDEIIDVMNEYLANCYRISFNPVWMTK